MIYKKNQKINNYKEATLIFCSFFPVGLEDYLTYFINNFKEVIYLKWKFPHSQSRVNSEIIHYQGDQEKFRRTIFSWPVFRNKFFYFLFLPPAYCLYFFQSLFLLWKSGSRPRIFFGINYVCAFCGIVLKKLGRADFVIYRVMDFFPLPASGPYRILNKIFYKIDKFCLENADSIWFTTEGHIIGREKYGYFNRGEHDYRMIPLGLDINKFLSDPLDEDGRYSLVYCGTIIKYHLLDLLFEVMAELKKDFPAVKLNLIGTGPDENYFKELAKNMELQNNIIFHGFMTDGEEFGNLMSRNVLGIAFYRDEENSMKYTEPAKVKYYLSFGVPAIVSNVPPIAQELHDKRVSFAVNNDKSEITEVIRRFILNPSLQAEYKNNIQEFVKSIDVNALLETSFKNTFPDNI